MGKDAIKIIFEYQETMFKLWYSKKSDNFLGIYIWTKQGFIKLRGWKGDGSLEIIKKLKYFFNSLELSEEEDEE